MNMPLAVVIRDLAAAALLSFSFVVHAASYSITRVGFVPADSSEYWANDAYDINNSGQIVGTGRHHKFKPDTGGYAPTGVSYGFLYGNGTLTNLGTLGGDSTTATGLNELGQVAGSSMTAAGQNHAFLYSNGVMTDLGAPGGERGSAVDVNNRGDVLINSGLSGNVFLYRDGTMIDLGIQGEAHGINDHGQIVGAFSVEARSHAFLYSDGVTTDLGDVMGVVSSNANAINDHGQIVGYAFMSPPGIQTGESPFLYDEGAMTDLGKFNFFWGTALDINNNGEAVGMLCPSRGGPCQGFLHRDGRMIDLNDLLPADSGWTLLSGNAINDAGQIVGWGSPGGAFLLSPVSSVPLPATVWLFISGLLGLIGMSRRSRKSPTNALAAEE